MAELRQNIATKEWVIISSDRSKRPDEFTTHRRPIITDDLPEHDENCPFCIGNEEIDLEVDRMPSTGKWQTRVVGNRYPALSKEGSLVRTFKGVERHLTGVGYHEVVVEHPLHNTTPAFMTPEEIHVWLLTLYNRGWGLSKDPRVEQIIYFKNHGQSAGASLKHPHSQIIALPVVPTDIRHRTEHARRYFDDNGECVMCVMVRDELEKKARLIHVSEHFAVFSLYAAPAPFHTWIVPRQHSVSFLYSKPQQMADLAHVLKNTLRRLHKGLNDPAYNLIIRTAPVKEITNEYFHWYITVIPRLSRTAGFELGSGMFINPSIPEECASFLRSVKM